MRRLDSPEVSLLRRLRPSLCRPYFWHSGTWTRVAPLALASVTAVVTSACNFSDFTKTTPPAGEPACTESLLDDATVAKPMVHWSFDEAADASSGGPWLDSVQQLPLTPRHETVGGPIPSYASIRLNGDGQAIEFDGHQYAEYSGSAGDALFPEETAEFTVSAWISLPAGGLTSAASTYPFVWPIISTLGDAAHCGGYQLDLRVEDPTTGPELVFSYQYVETADGGAPCGTHQVATPIDNAPWAWGKGRWHHVAATYTIASSDQASLALYWDGSRPTAGFGAVAKGRLTYKDYRFYLGTNSEAANTVATKFVGTIDEVAVFDTALEENALRDFVASTSTRPGPSGCRWTTYEQSDDVSQLGPSRSTWSSLPGAESLQVLISDNDWGAGFVSAHLSSSKDLSRFSTVHLEVDVPSDKQDKNFQFSLAHGNDFCTWLLPADGSGSYDIDLSRPSSCSASGCQFPPTSVDRATISTDWKDAAQSPLQMTVRSLEFRKGGNPVDSTTYGGAIGPKGWCWRPAAYEVGALASLVGTPSPSLVAATLSGPTNSSTRITADFGARVLDLEKCARVEISGELQPLGNSAPPYSFALQDINGAWADWDIKNNGARIDVPAIATSDNESDDHAYTKFPDFQKAKVSQISIQKPYLYPGSANVKISDIRFLDKNDQPGCEVWGAP